MATGLTPQFIVPDWPAPAGVRAVVTTRHGGVSLPPYDSFNLGSHVEDLPAHVDENRRRLVQALDLDREPAWLSQVHGVRIVRAEEAPAEADGAWTDQAGPVCAVLTADCLPVLFCDQSGTRIAAAHAGWRGLAGGVLEAAVAALNVAPGELLAWLGPAIGPEAFEVGEEVHARFLADDPGSAACFKSSPQGRWLADLYALARRRLERVGLTRIYGGGFCTYTDAERFYSFRRQPRTGRMASLIWRLPRT